MTGERSSSKTKAPVQAVEDGRPGPPLTDQLATEEPMETRLVAGGRHQTVAVTMRTPGYDFDLAVGFLYGEGVITSRQDVRRVSYCLDQDVEAEQRYNIVNVELSAQGLPDLQALERHFYTSSACGVCGKASIEALRLREFPALPPTPVVRPVVLYGIPDRLRAAQGLFADTGGLHAAALFDDQGALMALREDVGRHNAVDKLVGWALTQDMVPLHRHILMVSGRSSFEILQKSVAAGVPIVCSVSAPSSLAVAVAKEFGVTLVGFLRGRKFNIYAGDERLAVASAVP